MAAIGLFINSTEQGFTVSGRNNNFFPDNATLAYPANSVILITDESDMATFRSASNYDVLFSALIKDININGEQVTKDNIIETFNEAANKPSGGGGNPDAFTSVEYDGTKSLIFYNDKGVEVANVDVTPFIKDGMVSNVEILNGNLVITFNTDSGKQPITIPLTDIFNPANYYDKTTADSTFATQVVVNEEIAARIQGDADINTALQAKADKTDTYTKTQVDDALALKQDASTAFSGDYNDLTNKPTIPTVPTNVSAFTNDAGYLTEHQSLADYVDVTTFNKKELATAKALTQLNDTKADKTELPDVSTLATKTELNAKANSADLATVATSGSYNDLSDKPVIPEGVTVDAALSDTSENPVQNKVVKGALDTKQNALQYYREYEYDEETGEGGNVEIQSQMIYMTASAANDTVDSIELDGKISLNDIKNDGSGNKSKANISFVTGEIFIDVLKEENGETNRTLMLVNPTGVTINNEKVLTESDGVYYVDFAAMSVQGITDADWDGLVNAINAHRPIYAGLPGANGLLYYTAECLYQDGSNIIRMTASDHNSHYFYMFTKRGTNDYTMTYEVRPYVTEVEKHNWSAKQDALISGTNIKTINNQSIIGSGNIEIQGGGGGMDEDTELLISSALVDLNDRKIDATEVKENYQKKGDYATNAKVDTKANISDVPTNEDYEEAQKITSWSLNELNKRIVELEARVAQLEA